MKRDRERSGHEKTNMEGELIYSIVLISYVSLFVKNGGVFSIHMQHG